MSSSRGLVALAVVAGAFSVLLIVQVFLAGLGVFQSPTAFETHRNFGYGISFVSFAMLVIAIVGRTGRTLIGLSALAVAQMFLQSVFVAFRTSQPAIAALHPVNGFLLLLVALWIARTAWQRRRVPGVAADVRG